MALRLTVGILASIGMAVAAFAQLRGSTDGGAAVTASGPLHADFDGSGALDALDYISFQNRFTAGDPDADFDGSGTLDLFDFLAFNNAFASGTPGTFPAEPDWMDNVDPGQWCTTQEHYIAGLIDQGVDPVAVICAEVGPCDNPDDRDASIPNEATPIKTYRLSIHVFCEDNGSNCTATQSDVDTAVAQLNADYAQWRIQFVYETEFINSTKYRNYDAANIWFMKKTYSDSPASKLNVYVINAAGIGSWGTFPWDTNALGKQGGIVMHQTMFVTTRPVFAHEVGHCLGLWHTHHGVSEVTACGDCYEAAGRSEADGNIAGDRCEDTNPTPTSGVCDNYPGSDTCSPFNPWGLTPYLNYMGYALTCADQFTPQQAGRMHCWAADRLSGWLQVPMPPATPGSPALTKLGGGQVQIAWADNSNNEDGFRVQREKKSGAVWGSTWTSPDLGANTTSISDGPGPGTFRYRVQAFNGIGDSAWSGWTQIKN
jgi:hypothetical protein